VTDYYVPSREEVDDFDDLLAEAPEGALTKELISDLAGRFFKSRMERAGKPMKVTHPAVGGGEEWFIIHPHKDPAAAAAQTQPEAAQAKPPEPPSPAPRGREVPEGVEQARKEFQKQFGNTEGVKVISISDEYDVAGTAVFDAYGNVKGGGEVHGVYDAQAMAELAALPKYGDAGWGRRALRDVQQRAAQRAAAGQAPVDRNAPRRADRDALASAAGKTWEQMRHEAGRPKPFGRRPGQ
jgi:hypothetical protein